MRRSLIARLPLLGLSPEEIERVERTEKVVREECGDLKKLWNSLASQFFPGRVDLASYEVVWSTRSQKRTLASCSLTRKRVTVARELQPPEHQRWLEPLLYHEMCHAVLGLDITRSDGKRAWHGKEFKELESRHPETSPFHLWVNQGGWSRAVRSDRAKRAARKRQKR